MVGKKKVEYDITGIDFRDAFKEFVDAEKKRLYLEMEFAPVVNPLEQARQEAQEAQKILALVMDRDGVPDYEADEFDVKVVKQRLVEYDARLLPKHVRKIPGVVVEKVDKSTIERALANGVIDEEDVAHARSEKFKSPYVAVKLKTTN